MWDFETALGNEPPLYVKIIERGNNMKNPWLKKKEGVSMETCRGVAARIWCDEEYSHIVMNPKICEKIALMLFEVANHDELIKKDIEYFRSRLTESLNFPEEYHG